MNDARTIAAYLLPGSIVLHDGTAYLYAGAYAGLPGYGTVLPEIHPGEWDPHRERVVRLDALTAVNPAVGWERAAADEFTPLNDPLESIRHRSMATDRLGTLEAIVAAVKDWDIGQYRATGRLLLPQALRAKIQETLTT